MITKDQLDKIHKAVPVDYYEAGLKYNPFQRYWHNRRFKLVTAKLKDLQLKGRILDLGCHSGDLTNVIKKATGNEVFGLDISEKSIEYAKRRFPDINFYSVDFPAEKIFAASHFEAITCFDVMEHLPDLEDVICEIRRMLVSGGYLIMAIPNENLLFKIVWWWWLKFNGRVWEDVHVHNFRQEGFKLFEENNF
ncbi:MAG: class I SAM-dependent methyltransferase [Patescibacteria group bacterium]|jgi:2-polyprenyl-3-methyl-5-hydroxy-6-metoxy-1,4-benzoquinol methylase|nr:class I SAM-dependent methyltransferase [Patescibacteria group bacterium]